MLHDFLAANTTEIVARTRARMALRTTPVPTSDELKNGAPIFLSQLVDLMRVASADGGAMDASATLHGGELLAMGFNVSQVIHGYGDICQAVTEIADEMNALITAEEFHTFNRCLDGAIAHAVTEFERQRDLTIGYDGMERVGVLAHELRNRLSAATLAFTMLQEGTVGPGGSTSAVLGRSLRAMSELVNNALAGVRIEAGAGARRRVSIAQLVGDAQMEACLGAGAHGFGLLFSAVANDIHVEVDQQIIAAALGNLLHNAFKFTRPKGLISLRTTATATRVLIEVEDECGGLGPGRAEELFRPFHQAEEGGTGLGLGLTISRRGIEAMGGTLSVKDLPGKGCIFSIELPRLPPS